MAIVSKAAVETVAAPRVEAHMRADLLELSGATAFSVIGLCLSLMAITFANGGEWLLALAKGF